MGKGAQKTLTSPSSTTKVNTRLKKGEQAEGMTLWRQGRSWDGCTEKPYHTILDNQGDHTTEERQTKVSFFLPVHLSDRRTGRKNDTLV